VVRCWRRAATNPHANRVRSPLRGRSTSQRSRAAQVGCRCAGADTGPRRSAACCAQWMPRCARSTRRWCCCYAALRTEGRRPGSKPGSTWYLDEPLARRAGVSPGRWPDERGKIAARLQMGTGASLPNLLSAQRRGRVQCQYVELTPYDDQATPSCAGGGQGARADRPLYGPSAPVCPGPALVRADHADRLPPNADGRQEALGAKWVEGWPALPDGGHGNVLPSSKMGRKRRQRWQGKKFSKIPLTRCSG
jgi:hypothetical protein